MNPRNTIENEIDKIDQALERRFNRNSDSPANSGNIAESHIVPMQGLFFHTPSDAIDLEQQLHAAEAFVLNDPYAPEHSKSYLNLANLSWQAYRNSLVNRQIIDAHKFIQGIHSLIDDILLLDEVREKLTPAASFIAGMTEGVTGIKHLALPGHEEEFCAGQVLGSAMDLATDAVALVSAATIGSSGIALSITSSGLLVPIGSLAVAEAGALSIAAEKMSEIHIEKYLSSIKRPLKIQMEEKGRTQPVGLGEKLAMKETVSRGNKGTHIMKDKINDPRYSGFFLTRSRRCDLSDK